MLKRFLQRLQGRPAPRADARDVDQVAVDPSADVDAVVIARDELGARFLRHLLDTPAAEPAADDLADDILDRLDAVASRLDPARLPRLPALVPQLLAALRRDDVDANALAAMVARDPTLAGAVVRSANSVHYRRGTQVSALPQAIGVVGNEGLRYVVLTSVMRPILQADPSQQGARAGQCLVAQGEARTWICGALATRVDDPGQAQLASIIASTGTAALLRMMPHALLAQAAADPSFAPRFFRLAADLSARTAAHWRLDAALQQALQAMPGDASPSPLAAMLSTADALSMLHVLRRAGALEPGVALAGIAASQQALLRSLDAMDADEDAVPA
ncbi:MAG TPA: HDOD domain-containing protein [Luteimonas sp.]